MRRNNLKCAAAQRHTLTLAQKYRESGGAEWGLAGCREDRHRVFRQRVPSLCSFSISASTRMSIGQALGVFEYLNLPAFESRCLQVTQFTAADVATLELHKLRSPRPFASAPSGRTVSDRFASILSRHLHSGEESSDGRGQGSSRLSMEEAIAAGPDARMSISREHKDAILAERSPAYMLNKYANSRMLASDTLKPSFETTMARYKAEHATANEYTPEQQKEIRLARLMVPSFGLRHLEEHKLPPHLL